MVPEGNALTLKKVALVADKARIDVSGRITDVSGPVGDIAIKAGALNFDQLLALRERFRQRRGDRVEPFAFFARARGEPERWTERCRPDEHRRLARGDASDDGRIDARSIDRESTGHIRGNDARAGEFRRVRRPLRRIAGIHARRRAGFQIECGAFRRRHGGGRGALRESGHH